MPFEEEKPTKKTPLVPPMGEHVFWLALAALLSASVLTGMGGLDGGQYLIVTTGILSILGVKAANGK